MIKQFLRHILLFLSIYTYGENRYLNDIEISITTASSKAERAYGLKNRISLNENEGMLFIWPELSRKCMWMKDTSIPLSLAYLDENFSIREIYNLEPFSLESQCSKSNKIKYALEMNQGWFKKNNVTIFSKLK